MSQTLRTDLTEQAFLAYEEAARAEEVDDLPRAMRLLAAADLLDELALEAGPDQGAPTAVCVDCDLVEDFEHLVKGADEQWRCESCDEEINCPCCAALDAGDLEMAYVLAMDEQARWREQENA